MANSLRAKIKQLRHKGKITQQEYDEIIKKLDGHDEKQLGKWIKFVKQVIERLWEECDSESKKIEKMKNTSVPSFEAIDISRGYIMGLQKAVEILLEEYGK